MIEKDMILPNGKTVGEAEEASRKKIESIYIDCWKKGISVPFFDNKGNTYLANPDGSEDEADLDYETREYTIIKRIAEPGQGRFAYLLDKTR